MAGKKIHTIREDKPGRWKAGNTIHFATGVRTKHYDNFMMGDCESTQHIFIANVAGYGGANGYVMIDGKRIGEIFFDENGNLSHCDKSINELAKNDGFKNGCDFFNWFDQDTFSGKIIHWTDLKY